jgi:anti-anti-sigma factor
VGGALTRHEEGGLAIDVAERGGALVLGWRGRSDAREPGRFLVPVLEAALERARAGGCRLVLDFTSVEYMNSSTFTPIVKLVAQARAAGVRLALEYSLERSWQALSFSALRTFETRDGRVTVSGR